ncbi:MAG TPA: hypothetical protein DCS93_09585 [Microscillaceae bacterium]|nr:hypothetical protein [Microscillaceae bacterium]
MKSFKNFKHQEIDQPQAIKGGGIIRRGKLKKKSVTGDSVEASSFAVAANGKGTKQTATRASGKPQLL